MNAEYIKKRMDEIKTNYFRSDPLYESKRMQLYTEVLQFIMSPKCDRITQVRKLVKELLHETKPNC